MNKEMSINQRLKEYFDTLGISAYRFAELLGISQTGLNSAINGKNRPGVKILLALEKTDLNYNWLFRGIGPMRLKDQPTIINGGSNNISLGQNSNNTNYNLIQSEHLEQQVADLRAQLADKEEIIQLLKDKIRQQNQ